MHPVYFSTKWALGFWSSDVGPATCAQMSTSTKWNRVFGSSHVGVLRHSENISKFCASADPGAHI